jgi:4-alpha-glucanotransferase
MMKTTKKRQAGVLMPVSSLPSDCGIGTLGDGAYAFVDWLQSAGMRVWQVLPLLPTSYGDSPYQSYAERALNYYFIDFAFLAQDGLLTDDEYKSVDWGQDERRVDYGAQYAHKAEVLKKAFARFDKSDKAWQDFLKKGEYYDFAVFKSLKKKFGDRAWTEWDEPFQTYDENVVSAYVKENADDVAFWQFTQFLFCKQWNALKAYANKRNVQIMGDMPIYLAFDSVETWKYGKDLFLFDERGNPSVVAGVPPDAFSEDGQLWGNPVYDWEKMEKDGYAWWRARIAYALKLFDIVRIDHFRAFDEYFAVPVGAETAKAGEWRKGPGAKLFAPFKGKEIVAEDLGIITDSVRKMMKKTGYPGMKVFSFGFNGDDENEHLPTNYPKNAVAYTGTHDNAPIASMIESMDGAERKAFESKLEEECLALDTPYIVETLQDECNSVVELLFATKANTVVLPMHDVLAYGEEARLNAPSTVSGGNWTFRYLSTDFKRKKAFWLKELTEKYKR